MMQQILEEKLHCPVCMHLMSSIHSGHNRRSCICAPCGHRFCCSCLIKWSVRKNTCPTCRNEITAIVPDHDFDILARFIFNEFIDSTETVSLGDKPKPEPLLLYPSDMYGIEISKIGQHPGVIVSKAEKGYAAYMQGIRSGDIIVSIDELPVDCPNMALNMIKRKRTCALALHLKERQLMSIKPNKYQFKSTQSHWGLEVTHCDEKELNVGDVILSCNGLTRFEMQKYMKSHKAINYRYSFRNRKLCKDNTRVNVLVQTRFSKDF